MAELTARNPAVQHLRRLSRRRSARTDAGAFVIDGPVLVAAALDAGIQIDTVYVDASSRDQPEAAALLDDLRARAIRVLDLAPGVLAGAVDTVTPHAVAAIARPRTVELTAVTATPTGLVVVLADVRDPGNAGTLLRSADAAGAAAVVVTAGSVDVFGPKTVRASAGALFHLRLVVGAPGPDAIDALVDAGFTCFTTVATGGTPYDEADLTRPTALVLGNEAHGVPVDVADRVERRLTIPMLGRAESLNVAMAGTVLCFEAARQRRAATGTDRPDSASHR